MAISYGLIVATAIAIAAVSFGIPWILSELFPWRSLWQQRHSKPAVTTESYKGRTVLITGANGAFGSRAARNFAQRDVETLVLVDVKDCASLKEEIEAEVLSMKNAKPNILVWQIDMMSFSGCQELQKKARELRHLDHVLMTMGILSFNRRESPEGWETSIQVNFLSNALLGLLLVPLLKSSPTNPNPPVMTFITTFGVYPASLTMSVPKTGSYLKSLSNNPDGMAQANQYGRSKALLLYFARELASRVTAAGTPKVTINSADPGTAWTGLTSPNRAMLIPRLITNFGARDPQFCANHLVNAVSCSGNGHGKIMMDYDTAAYPPFMERKSGHMAQQRVWQETRSELEAKVPEVKSVYEMLDRKAT